MCGLCCWYPAAGHWRRTLEGWLPHLQCLACSPEWEPHPGQAGGTPPPESNNMETWKNKTSPHKLLWLCHKKKLSCIVVVLMCFIWTRVEYGDVGVPAYRHGSDIQGLWGVHLAELPEGFSPASPTYTLLVLPLPILDQTPTNCTKKEEMVGINSVSEKLQHLLNLCYSLLIMYFFNKVGKMCWFSLSLRGGGML